MAQPISHPNSTLIYVALSRDPAGCLQAGNGAALLEALASPIHTTGSLTCTVSSAGDGVAVAAPPPPQLKPEKPSPSPPCRIFSGLYLPARYEGGGDNPVTSIII